MSQRKWDNRSYRGFLQSGDGVITRVLKSNARAITFETEFQLSDNFIQRLNTQSANLVFSERSRIARLGISIQCEPPNPEKLTGDRLILTQKASSVIAGYPSLGTFKDFFTRGLPVGRLVYCNPDALLTSDEVLSAIERSELKLPESTTVSSDGSIWISPHKVVCNLKPGLDKDTIGRILFRENGREILNRHQVSQPVSSLTIPPGKGVVTTCSMYLNEHYVVLQSGFSLGEHLPATILDPIKTRGIRIYLEIVNGSKHPIVNPLISARVYRVPKPYKRRSDRISARGFTFFSYPEMKSLEANMDQLPASKCHHLNKPVAVIPNDRDGLDNVRFLVNGPKEPCTTTDAACAVGRRDFTAKDLCAHQYATADVGNIIGDDPGILVLKFFPNLLEHRDIINLACDGRLGAIYFHEASCEHGPFLSEQDHSRLSDYEAFGVDVYWVSTLN
ncbi:MAG: hypothetical protein JRH15_04840, partial [Deltaproteobacteria bacterium]|nr:hypothetical protein [Deltaproteobacteria bacterium]